MAGMSVPASLTGITIAVLGGTGPQGRGLARRFACAGMPVILGSRDAARADEVAGKMAASLPEGAAELTGADNAAAAERGDIVLVVVPWEGHRALLEELAPHLAGKVVIDCVNPLGFDKQGAFVLPVDEGSAAQQAQSVLPGSTVVGAFHNVSAVLLEDPDVETIDTDVLVLGDVREATDLAQDLVSCIPGVRGIYGGRLRNSHQVEALTANLISINRRYKVHAGIRITDL